MARVDFQLQYLNSCANQMSMNNKQLEDLQIIKLFVYKQSSVYLVYVFNTGTTVKGLLQLRL